MNEGEALIEVRGATKRYARGPEQVRALEDVSLELARGELVALIGRSGSGKTTLLNLLCGWDRPDEGTVTWLPSPMAPLGDLLWSEIAVVPQTLGLVDELSIRENIELPLRTRPGQLWRDRNPHPRVEALLKALGLADLADRSPGEVSLGEQQRGALARALVLLPSLLLADEPTGHQDELWARGVMRLLRFAAAKGVCCLVATHNHEVVPYADQVITVRDGHLADLETTQAYRS
jgi:putative ABC transport system ATP-binding protein